MEFMGIDDARPVLGELINKASYQGTPTGITRHGKPVAVLVGVDEWRVLRAKAGLDDGIPQDGEKE